MNKRWKEKSLTPGEVSDKERIDGGFTTGRVLRPVHASSTGSHNSFVINQCRYVATLASTQKPRNNRPVLFNSSTGLGGPYQNGGQPPYAAFFASVIRTIGAPSMAGRGRGVLARAGSILPVRQPCHWPASPLGGEESGLTLRMEATMPSITRALSRLFPISSTIGTAANLAEAQALARLHLALTGHAVRIAPAAVGFDIVEVR